MTVAPLVAEDAYKSTHDQIRNPVNAEGERRQNHHDSQQANGVFEFKPVTVADKNHHQHKRGGQAGECVVQSPERSV
jgi:hypothetical protein